MPNETRLDGLRTVIESAGKPPLREAWGSGFRVRWLRSVSGLTTAGVVVTIQEHANASGAVDIAPESFQMETTATGGGLPHQMELSGIDRG